MASGAAGSAVGSADVKPNPLEITARLQLGIKDELSSDRSTEKVRLLDDTNNLKTTQSVHLDDGRVLGAAHLVKDMVAKRGVMAAASPRAALAIETPKPRRRPAGVPASSSDSTPAAAKGSSGDAGSGDSVGDKLF